MISTLIRVEQLATSHQVQLFAENGEENWLATQLASAELPEIPDGQRCEEIRRAILEADGEAGDFEEIGHSLRNLLLDNEVGEALEGFARSQSTRVLIDPGTDALRRLPWELMRDSDGMPLFANPERPFARAGSDIGHCGPDEEPCWPLRVLLVVGSARDDPIVEAEREKESVIDAFRRVYGLVDLEVLERPSLEKLRQVYQRSKPHVFHFVGHGKLGHNGEGYLELNPAETTTRVAWRAQLIRTMFGGWKPRLAVLNACQSGDLNQQQGVLSVAATFARLGARAVVAMQGKITGTAAADFAASLYEGLARGVPIDRAVAEARLQILMSAADDQREYALPTLLLAHLPDSVLDLSRCDPLGLLSHAPFHRVPTFVNRLPDRRRLWDKVEPSQQAAVVTVTGDEQVGKSALVRWCLALRALHGDNVAYVDLERTETLDSAGLLDAVVAALTQAPTAYREENEAALMVYEREVAPMRVEGAWPDIFSAFGRALRTATVRAPIVIALDHLSGVETGAWKGLACEYMVKPIAEGQLPGVRLVLALGTSERSDRLPLSVATAVDEVPLMALRNADYVAVATQFLRTFGIPREDVAKLVDALHGGLGESWSAREFGNLEELIKGRFQDREQ